MCSRYFLFRGVREVTMMAGDLQHNISSLVPRVSGQETNNTFSLLSDSGRESKVEVHPAICRPHHLL